MSLFRQLWLAVIVSMLIAFSGSFVVSMLTARHYLEHQLAVKNTDNASSLALSVSQSPKDRTTVDLLVSALFDSGQYALVRVMDPDNQVMAERVSPPVVGSVPQWFIKLFPIESIPGQAQISNGWTQFGVVQLVSHNAFAYQELWSGGIDLLIWFASGSFLLGLMGMQVVRRISQPLDALVAQAQAISEQRFVQIAEPRTPELRSLARAMNAMVLRLKAIFAEEAERLEQVRREANLDSLTGLANRRYFMNQLDVALNSDDAPPAGMLLILRLADLGGINKQAGREVADEVLRRTAGAIAEFSSKLPGSSAARLNGADFALLMPGQAEPEPIAQQLLGTLRHLASSGLIDNERIGHVAVGGYDKGESTGALLAGVDATLAVAETQGKLGWAKAESGFKAHATSNSDWKKLLETAIANQRLRLIEFPVTDNRGDLLHLECPLRLQADENGEWLTAGSFMPMASRLSMTCELDLAAVRLALERIAAGVPALAINLSGESIRQEHFRKQLQSLLAASKELASHLWLEVAEIGAFQYFAEFREFCDRLRPLGCRLGIEHFARQFSEIGRLHDIGLDYLKVDGSFIRSIDQQPGNQTFLKGLCSIAHDIGLTVIAESVQTAEELAALPDLGFDGATGPAVNRH